MARFVYIIRWLLVPASAVLGWFMALFGSLFLVDFIYNLCPPELIVSGLCTTKWYSPAESATIFFGSALSAAFVVLFPTLFAPKYRFRVAVVAYCMGVLALLWLGQDFFRTPEWFTAQPLVAALVAGLLTVFLIKGWLLKRDRRTTL